jgi:iron complex transport system substrate-binding protein
VGDKVVGVSRFSDYPTAARRLPVVGDSVHLDLERTLALRPDVVVAWGSGTPAVAVEKLETLGIPVFVLEPRRLTDVAQALRDLGRLAGTEPTARRAAHAFEARADRLKTRFAHRRPVRVFVQINAHPLLTLSGGHLVNEILELCGGSNVFADQPVLVPQVGVEDVIHADPEAILIAQSDAPGAVQEWQRQPELRAVRERHVFLVPPDLISRQGPRILDGAEVICRDLEQVRAAR